MHFIGTPGIVTAGLALVAFLFADAWFCSQDGRGDVASEIMWILGALIAIALVVLPDLMGGALWT